MLFLAIRFWKEMPLEPSTELSHSHYSWVERVKGKRLEGGALVISTAKTREPDRVILFEHPSVAPLLHPL